MRKITIIEHISLDGVIQAPGGPNEDPPYPYGGWAGPHADTDGGAAIVAAHGEAFDLLLGRRTYDIWTGFWPKAPKSPMADSINAATKYVATHRPKSLAWGPAADLGADIVEGIRRIKAKSGPHLIVWGSSTLTPVLLEHGLADELLLLVFPVLLGTGKRIFSEGPRPANSRSSAPRLCPRASSSAHTGPVGFCGPVPTLTRRSERAVWPG
ncbi:MAG TPA: dihydrofolate reductase family protein [Terriglobales bacterium]|jgi:dihydrofolate reductase|nr:dihydrofolate reductase family protein [Terriglobales bacterium]